MTRLACCLLVASSLVMLTLAVPSYDFDMPSFDGKQLSFDKFLARNCREENGCRRSRSLQRRLSGGTPVSGCDYPGMVAFTAYSFKAVVCEGVYTGSKKVVVTTDCYNQLRSLNKGTLSKETLTLYGGDGSATVSIKGGTLTGNANGDGTTTITLPSDSSLSSCPGGSPGTFYTATSNIDTTTCSFLSYGGDTDSLPAYSRNLTALPLTTSSLQTACCQEISDILGSSSRLGSYNPAYLYTCTSTAGAVCGGDLGAPIYCKDKTTGKQVVVGMATSYGCILGETFLSLDLTGGTLAGFSST